VLRHPADDHHAQRSRHPGTGSFISPDPLLKPYVPQNLNAYAYAADNPSTYSDPSGASIGQYTGGSTGCAGSAAADKACDTKAQQEENQPKGAVAQPIRPGTGSRLICDPNGICASVPYHRKHPSHADPKPGSVLRTPPGHQVTSGKDKHGCPVAIIAGQIGFALGSCLGEGVTTGINLNASGDDGEQSGGDPGDDEGQRGGIVPGEGTRGLEDQKIGPPSEFDPDSLTGLTPGEVEAQIPSDWVREPSNSGGGVVYRDPHHRGRQIRIMPGYENRPDPITNGPYVVVSQNGRTQKVPLAGNPVLQ
jgi:hypothetical protein